MKKIYSTKDYSRFSFLENNRIVKRSHVNEFKEEIKKNDRTMCFPIVVDPNLRIIDGQHRFHACMELGLPIYYVVDDDDDAEQAMINCNKINKKWEMMDWLRYRANKNGGCYKQLLDFVQQTGTTISNAMVIYPGKAINAATLRAGTTDFGVNEKAFDIVHFLQSEYVKELSLDMIAKTKDMQKEYKYRYMREVKQILAYAEKGLITDFEAVSLLIKLPEKIGV